VPDEKKTPQTMRRSPKVEWPFLLVNERGRAHCAHTSVRKQGDGFKNTVSTAKIKAGAGAMLAARAQRLK
jgi:hypothetical protein